MLSGRIKCGDCGGWYGSKVWHSPEKCKQTVWQCNQKYKNEVHCTTPYLDEASVKERFTVAVNQLLAGRDTAIAVYELGMAKALPRHHRAGSPAAGTPFRDGSAQRHDPADDPAERFGRAGPDRIQQALRCTQPEVQGGRGQEGRSRSADQ
ncbi:MAG: zinc ribbon domain-containing protein [Oscillospiraceae bacterium]|nr:zinc ribbon domain-containing protein [Oscillospiraceae bacterium]